MGTNCVLLESANYPRCGLGMLVLTRLNIKTWQSSKKYYPNNTYMSNLALTAASRIAKSI